MKHFKLLSLLLGLCVCTFAFTACGDDDDDSLTPDTPGYTTNSISRESIEKCVHGFYAIYEADANHDGVAGMTIALTPYTREELDGMIGDFERRVPMVGIGVPRAKNLTGEFTNYAFQYFPNCPLFAPRQSSDTEHEGDAPWLFDGLEEWDCWGVSYATGDMKVSNALSITKVGDKYSISCSNANFYGTLYNESVKYGTIGTPLGEHTTPFSITCTLEYDSGLAY